MLVWTEFQLSAQFPCCKHFYPNYSNLAVCLIFHIFHNHLGTSCGLSCSIVTVAKCFGTLFTYFDTVWFHRRPTSKWCCDTTTFCISASVSPFYYRFDDLFCNVGTLYCLPLGKRYQSAPPQITHTFSAFEIKRYPVKYGSYNWEHW